MKCTTNLCTPLKLVKEKIKKNAFFLRAKFGPKPEEVIRQLHSPPSRKGISEIFSLKKRELRKPGRPYKETPVTQPTGSIEAKSHGRLPCDQVSPPNERIPKTRTNPFLSACPDLLPCI